MGVNSISVNFISVEVNSMSVDVEIKVRKRLQHNICGNCGLMAAKCERERICGVAGSKTPRRSQFGVYLSVLLLQYFFVVISLQVFFATGAYFTPKAH